MINSRTTAALAAAKARGVTLGNPKLSKARKNAVATIKALADQHASNVLPVVRESTAGGRNVAPSDSKCVEREGHHDAARRPMVRILCAERVTEGLIPIRIAFSQSP